MEPRYQRAIGKYLLALPLQLERQHVEVLPEEEDLLQALGQQVLPPGVADEARVGEQALDVGRGGVGSQQPLDHGQEGSLHLAVLVALPVAAKEGAVLQKFNSM